MQQHQPPQQDRSPDSASNSTVGEDVMKILEDVEGQLTKLRSAQKTRDDAVTSLGDRSKALQKAEDELESQRQELSAQQKSVQREREQLQSQRQQLESTSRQTQEQLRKQQDELDETARQLEQDTANMAVNAEAVRKRQAELEQAQKNWEQQRKLLEVQLDNRHAEVEARAAELTKRQDEFQAERDRVAALAKQCQQQQEQFAVRAKEMESERGELQSRVDQAEANVGDLIKEIEKSQQGVAEKTRQLTQSTADAALLRQKASELEQSVQKASQRISQLESDSAELVRMADGEREEVSQKLKASESQRQELTQKCKSMEPQLQEMRVSRDAAMAEIEAARNKAVLLDKSNRALQSQIAELQTRLSDSQEKLGLAGRKLAEFAQVLGEQTPQLEKGAAAIAMVEQQQEQMERLTKQLAESKLKGDPEEMDRRDKRIEELTDALRQARGQSAGAQGVAEVELRNAELEKQIDRLRLDLEQAELAANDATRQLREQLDSQAVETVQDASIASHTARIAALSAEIESLQSRAEAELKARLEDQSRRYQQELAEHHNAETAAMKSLQKRVTELEGDLEAASQLAEESERKRSAESASNEDSEYADMLRDRAERVSAVAEHLRRRRTRLAKMRQLIRGKQIAESVPSGSMQLRNEQIRKLEFDRAQVEDARRALATTEREMIRKWAKPRAMNTVAVFTLLAFLCAGASWMVAGYVSPPRLSAAIVLEARNRAHTPLTAQEAEQWRTWHTELLNDPKFHEVLASRMTDLRMARFTDPTKLGQRLSTDLTHDTHQPGLMILTMAGTEEDDLAMVLDVLGTTVASESERRMSQRNENTWAAVTGERREEGRIRFATQNATPISDTRMKVAPPIFGGMMLVMIVLGVMLYRMLARAKRVFDEQGSIDSNEASLSTI